MFLSGLLASFSLIELIHAGQQSFDYDFQANFCGVSEQKSVFNSTSQVLAVDPDKSCGRSDHIHNSVQLSPWTHKPDCIHNEDNTEEYCVFTNESFAHGRGISFFTSPSIAARVAELSAFTNSTVHDNVNKFENAPWEMRNVPGRGNGLFATRTLHRGDPIVADTPVGVFQSDAFFLDYPIGYKYLHKAFDRLPETTKEIVMRTAAHSPGDPYMERINTNAFAGNFEGASHFLFYPETAVSICQIRSRDNTETFIQLMNHDCRPKYVYDCFPECSANSLALYITMIPLHLSTPHTHHAPFFLAKRSRSHVSSYAYHPSKANQARYQHSTVSFRTS